MTHALPWRPIAGIKVHEVYGRVDDPLISLTMSIDDAYFLGTTLQERHRTTHDDFYLIGESLRRVAEDRHRRRLRSG